MTDGPRRLPALRDGVWDTPLYAVFAICAAAMFATSVQPAPQWWGGLATIPYLLAAVASLLARRFAADYRAVRWRILAGAVAGSVALPVLVLIVLRAAGLAWAAQLEVDVIENAARTLLHTGSPYVSTDDVHRALTVRDYMPYLPAMALFGLPDALFGDGALTEPRVYFALVTVACLVPAWRWYRRQHELTDARVLPVQLLAASPLTGLLVTGGDDAPVLALIAAAAVATQARRPGLAGALAAAAAVLKATAWPLLFLLLVLHAQRGRRELGRCALPAAAVLALGAISVLRNVEGFVEQTIRYPTGSADVASLAATPFPGYLLSHAAPWGRTAAIVLLLVVAAGIGITVLRRGIPDAAAALGWFAAGITAATLLSPATRFGYFVYVVVACAVAVLLREPRASRPRSGVQPPGEHGVRPAAEQHPVAGPGRADPPATLG